MTSQQGKSKLQLKNRVVMAQSTKRAFPPPPPPAPCICQAFVILSVPAVGICQKTSARGWGISQFF